MNTLLKVFAAIVAAGCLIGGWFWLEFEPSVREARQKEVTFRALDSAKFDRLIDLACVLEKRETISGSLHFGGYNQPEIPLVFADYGFERLEIRPGVVEGRVYWLVDSGGFARVDTKVLPLRLSFVKGDNGDIVDVLYEKKEPNKTAKLTDINPASSSTTQAPAEYP